MTASAVVAGRPWLVGKRVKQIRQMSGFCWTVCGFEVGMPRGATRSGVTANGDGR
jgi:hypothetical protein